MILQENPAAASELIRRANDAFTALHPRAEGVHVSDLIYCRRKAWYRRKAGTSEDYDTDTLVMFLLGHGHHALLEQGEAERRLTLVTRDGIVVHGTADHIVTLGDYEYPEEFKTTRASSNKSVLETMHYIDQLASYCVMMGVHQGRLTVLYISGNYKPPKPTIKTYDIRFTHEELARWEQELGLRARAILVDQPPLLSTCHRTWECKYCPFEAKKGGPCPGGAGDERQFFFPEGLPDFLNVA